MLYRVEKLVSSIWQEVATCIDDQDYAILRANIATTVHNVPSRVIDANGKIIYQREY